DGHELSGRERLGTSGHHTQCVVEVVEGHDGMIRRLQAVPNRLRRLRARQTETITAVADAQYDGGDVGCWRRGELDGGHCVPLPRPTGLYRAVRCAALARFAGLDQMVAAGGVRRWRGSRAGEESEQRERGNNAKSESTHGEETSFRRWQGRSVRQG